MNRKKIKNQTLKTAVKKIVSPFSKSLALVLLITILSSNLNAMNAHSAGVVATELTGLNVRSAPSTASNVVTTLPKGSYVTLESASGGWWYAEYADGQRGYLYFGYINKVDSRAGYVKTDNEYLNVRSGPDVSYPAVDALANDSALLVIDEYENGWGTVLYDGGTTGYVNLNYVAPYENNQPGYNYQPLTLDVVSYKQYDSRWGDLYIGSSYKKVKNIGCTITCVAMTESYRKDTTVTPDYIVKNSSFTSGGAYYWPENYNKSYTYEYKSEIYAKLLEGKPVIFESKNSNGTSHWVVITGYAGGDSLSTSDFIINDPGSSVRTTLYEHMKLYPYYSKIVYYN